MQSYDVYKPSKYITYLDEDNLYSLAMIKYFPYGGFKWLSQKEIDRFHLNSISKSSSHGYILSILINCINFIIITY